MKTFLILILLTASFSSSVRDLDLRRWNISELEKQFIYTSTVKIDILKGLSAYDLEQAQQNSGRLFIRDKIIYE